MKKALEKFDWAAVLAHLPDNGEESLKKLLTDITRTGVLIRVFSLSKSIEKRRAQFIEELTMFVSGIGPRPLPSHWDSERSSFDTSTRRRAGRRVLPNQTPLEGQVTGCERPAQGDEMCESSLDGER